MSFTHFLKHPILYVTRFLLARLDDPDGNYSLFRFKSIKKSFRFFLPILVRFAVKPAKMAA